MNVTLSMWPDLLASSALLTLTVYHLMIYWGRKKEREERYNLYFTCFVFSAAIFIIAPYFKQGYFLHVFRPHWLYVINIEMASIWLFFYSSIHFLNHVLKVSLSFRKKFRFCYVSISIAALLTLTSNVISKEFYFHYVLYYVMSIVAINVLSVNFLFAYWIYRERLYNDKFIRILYGGFLLLTFNMLMYRLVELLNSPLVEIPYHYLTAAILYVFTYAFSLKLNKEHEELKKLRLTVKARVAQQTISANANLNGYPKNHHAPMDISTYRLNVLSIDEQFLRKATQLIEENMNEDSFTTERFCKEIGISRAHLYRKLKTLTNQSATEFIRSVRLKRAAELLNRKTASVSEIAYTTGFNNLSYFTRRFKEEFGVVPSEYFSRRETHHAAVEGFSAED